MSEELQRGYERRFQENAAYRASVWRVLTREFFNRWIPAESTILDLGCGWGEFINQIPAARKFGMDLNPDSRSKLAPGITFLHQDCSEEWGIPEAHLDVVFTSNFFEHLPGKESLRKTLGQAFRCLKPGGLLICMGPNIKYLPGTHWDFWDHYLPLTELSLAEGLELSGFRVTQTIGRFLPYSMSQGFTPPIIFLRLYLQMPSIWRYFGRQFLVIGRKPEA